MGLDHPYPPPFSQQKGERKRNVGSRTGLLALETLRNWLSSDCFSLFLKTVQSSCEIGLIYQKMTVPIFREMSFHVRYNRLKIKKGGTELVAWTNKASSIAGH